MNTRIIFLLLCANGIFSFLSCHEAKPAPLNPNGDTELAILMRDMYDEALQIKKDMEAGKDIEIALDHGKILTAESTMPEKAASKEYKSFAAIYLDAVDKMKSIDEDPSTAYDNLVTSCTICHQSLCPGPLARIKNLQ